jgi:site-specific DNA-methyltransferase (adenine-specific)
MNKLKINRIYCGDALKLLKRFPDESMDMIFADPPYFGGQKGMVLNRTNGYAGSQFRTDKAQWAFDKSLAYQFDFAFEWLRDCKRILKRGHTIWVTGTYHSIGVINVVMQDLKYKILNEIVLVKKNAPPNFSGSCFRAITESMLWAKKSKEGKTKFNYTIMKKFNSGKQMSNVWEYVAIKNPFRFPATKQESILEKVILASTDEADLVLDPFAGSGTTAVVAKKLNRNWIMIDIDEKACRLADSRIQGII